MDTSLINKIMYACVLSRFRHVQLFATLWSVAHQASLSIGFSRQKYWSGLPCPPPGDPPDPGVETVSLRSPAWQACSVPLVPPGKPRTMYNKAKSISMCDG